MFERYLQTWRKTGVISFGSLTHLIPDNDMKLNIMDRHGEKPMLNHE